MRKLILLVLVCLFCSKDVVEASNDDTFLIRRAYYDTLGVFPSYVEIEWYCIYNSDNPYEVAVNWLINNPSNKWNIPKNYMKMLLLSDQYKNQKMVEISREEVYKNLFYMVGWKNLPITQENIKICSLKLIEFAFKCADNPLDIIDYFTNTLISRSTNVKEANQLMSYYKSIKDTKPEIEVWLSVLNEVLKFDDIKLK